MTPSELRGYKLGDKFRINNPGHHDYGRIVTLIEDDGTHLPLFSQESGGRHYYSLGNLMKINAEKETDMTPAKMAGIFEGDVVEIISHDNENGSITRNLPIGTRLILKSDDGSRCPYFTKVGEDLITYVPYLTNVKKVEDFSMSGGTTKQDAKGEMKLVKVTDYLQNGMRDGDRIITSNGKECTVPNDSSGPDSDNEFDTTNGYVHVDEIVAVYRMVYTTSYVEVTVSIPRPAAEIIERSGMLLTASEVDESYTEDYRRAVRDTVHAVQSGLVEADS